MIGELITLIAAGVGLLFGGIAVWLILRTRIAYEYDRAKGEFEAERAALGERLQSKDEQLRDLRAVLDKLNSDTDVLTAALRSESEKRATADEKSARIPVLESRLRERDDQIEVLRSSASSLHSRLAALSTQVEEERKSAGEKLALLEQARERLAGEFKAAASEALLGNTQAFMELAKATFDGFHQSARGDLEARQQSIGELVKPLRESLDKVDSQIRNLETARVGAYSTLTEQVKSLATGQTQLQSETSRLVSALRSPVVRGTWGEIQLKRVVEMAGMVKYCDFGQQESIFTEDGRLVPDMIIRLPNERRIIVDAKAPIEAYYESVAATDEETRVARLKDHARQVRTHLSKLSEKAYWEQFDSSPEFVVLFLPGETFFSAALEQEPGLIEFGVDRNVILATPTTLIALLKAVAYGWKQEQIAESAMAVGRLGKELYDRIRNVTGYFSEVGKSLNRAIDSYNKAIGSFENRVLVTVRRFKEMGSVTGEDIDPIEAIEKIARPVAGETALIPGLIDDEETDADVIEFPESRGE